MREKRIKNGFTYTFLAIGGGSYALSGYMDVFCLF